MKWIRTCQVCGNKQEDRKPDRNKKLTFAYCNRACKKCKSEALNYGSSQPSTLKEIEDAKKFIEDYEKDS